MAALIAVGGAVLARAAQKTPVGSATGPPHVLVVMLENKGYAATLGSCGAGSPDPYLCSLASSYASADSWFGIRHPSLPNYAAVVSGSTQGITSDCQPSSCGRMSAPELGGQLTAARIPWVGWAESMPSACDTGGDSGNYEAHHNPFAYFSDVTAAPNCASVMRPYPGASGAVSVLDGAAAPDFAWITPNVCDDMHSCPVSTGDLWLKANIQPILTSSWFANNGTVIITMDENDLQASGSCCGDAAGGQIPLVVISAAAQGRGTIKLTGDHFGTLRTIEEAYGLRLLGAATSASDGDFSSLLGGGGNPGSTPTPSPPTETPTGTPTGTPTDTPSETPTDTPTDTPTATPTPTGTASPTPTPPATQPPVAGVAQYSMAPAPIAATGRLHPRALVSIALTATDATGDAVPDASVFVQFAAAPGGGAAVVGTPDGTVVLGPTPVELTTDATGTLFIVYEAPAAPAAGGTDTLTAEDDPSTPTVVSTDSYTY